MAIETTTLKRNLSRLELALAILVIAVLISVFMRRMDTVSAAAERSILLARYQDMQSRLMSLRAGVITRQAQTAALRLDDVVRSLGRGDILFVPRETGFDWGRIGPGEWVYFRASHLLEYRVTHEEFFAVAAQAPTRVRFQLEPRYADIDGNGRYDEATERLEGATIRLLDSGVFNSGD